MNNNNKNVNVKIPLALMNQIIHLLGYWNLSYYDDEIRYDYDYVLSSLLEKRARLNLRETYTRNVFGKDDAARYTSNIGYLMEDIPF